MTESRLWQTWRAERDERAFEALVRPHLRFLQDFARRCGCRGADADDVVQATLVELARQQSDKPVRVGVRPWLGRGVRSHARMLHRSQGRRARHEERAPAPKPPKDPDLRDEVDAALAKLDDDSREAVVLRFLHDLEYREIAHVLRKSENACRLQVHRAIARLRRDLGGKAPALIAALPLLAGNANARMALTKSALLGGVVVGAKTKVALVLALILAAGALVVNGRRGGRRERATVERAMEPTPARHNETIEAAKAVPDETEPPAAAKANLNGTIRLEDGRPLVGVRVSFWNADSIEAITDANGRFRLVGLGDTRGALAIRGPNEYNLLIADLKRGEPAELALDPGRVVAGRVVKFPSGDPVVGAPVQLMGAGREKVTQANYGFVRTDEQGAFHFELVPENRYSISCFAPGLEGRETIFDLRHGPAPALLELKESRPLEVHFEGAPPEASGVEITWSMQGTNTWLMPEGKATIGDDFRVRLDAPPPGIWDVTIGATKFSPGFRRQVPVDGSPIVLRVDGARVTGTLRTANGEPVANARLNAARMNTSTDESGRFVFRRLTPGRPMFHLHAANGYLRLGKFEVPHSGELDLRLPGSAVVTASLPNNERARCMLYRLTPELDPVIMARPGGGSVRIPHLAAGDYRLEFSIFYGETIVKEFSLADGETHDLGTVTLRRYPNVPIIVSVPSGTELPRSVTVTYKSGKNMHGTPVSLDSTGRGTANGIPPGLQEMSFQATGFEAVWMDIQVSPDMAPVRVEMKPTK